MQKGELARLREENKRLMQVERELLQLRESLTANGHYILDVHSENKILRQLVDECENRIFIDSFITERDTPQEREEADAELKSIQQRMKMLGIPVNEE